MEADLTYFRRRSAQETAAAEAAADSRAREAHRELARRYSELAEALEPREPTIELRLVSAR